MRKIHYLFLMFFIVLSCNKNQIYHSFENLPEDKRWLCSLVQKHEFTIEEEANYSVYLNISNVFGTEMKTFPIELEITKPNGSIEKATIAVDLSVAVCIGDICDVKFPIRENLKLEKGVYKIQFIPKSTYGFVPNIIGVGLTVEKAQLVKE